jgi:hypothetical protein
MWLAGETEVLGENLPRRHFIHHKSHFLDPGAVGSQRLTASAMALPYSLVNSLNSKTIIGPENGHLSGLK